MPSDPPIDFEALAKSARGTNASDYPYAIKSRDLMKNFTFATLSLDDGMYEERAGKGGHAQRRLRIKAGQFSNQLLMWNGTDYAPIASPPGQGTWVLASQGGSVGWLPTEDCE